MNSTFKSGTGTCYVVGIPTINGPDEPILQFKDCGGMTTYRHLLWKTWLHEQRERDSLDSGERP
jgi:hypothetical protein